jgi:DNA polymerase III subunit delta'
MQSQLRFRPFEGNKRVIIVQDAQQFKEEAANAFLKVLEEPPRDHVFLLLALEPQMLLPTLVSRCCQVRLQPLPDSWLAKHLVDAYQMAEGQAVQAARQAMGSLTRARQLVESKHLEHRRKVLARVEELAQAPMIDFFQATSLWAKETQDLGQDLEILQFWLRDGIVSRLLGEDVPGPGVAREDPFAGRFHEVPIDYMFTVHQHIDQALRHLRGNANRQLTLEGVCLIIKDLVYGEGSWYSIPGGWQDLPLQSW